RLQEDVMSEPIRNAALDLIDHQVGLMTGSRLVIGEFLSAYDYYLRGLSFVNQWTREANKEALRTFNKAIELDPNFASAYGMAGGATRNERRADGGTIALRILRKLNV